MVNQIHKGTMPAFIGLGGVSLSLCLPSLSESLLPLIHLNLFSLSLPPFLESSLPSSVSSLFPPPLHLLFLLSFLLCLIFSPLFNQNKVVILVSASPFKRLQLWRRQQQVALLWKPYCMATAAAAPAPAQIPQTMPPPSAGFSPFSVHFSLLIGLVASNGRCILT